MVIEKRLPFGFRGDWGKLYKRFTPTATEESPVQANGVKVDVITYQDNVYRDIGMDVQFKHVDDVSSGTEQTAAALHEGIYTVAKTTDSYFDDSRQEYMCVVAVDDIVKVFGRLWTVTGVRYTTRHTPAEQKFYYCELKAID